MQAWLCAGGIVRAAVTKQNWNGCPKADVINGPNTLIRCVLQEMVSAGWCGITQKSVWGRTTKGFFKVLLANLQIAKETQTCFGKQITLFAILLQFLNLEKFRDKEVRKVPFFFFS